MLSVTYGPWPRDVNRDRPWVWEPCEPEAWGADYDFTQFEWFTAQWVLAWNRPRQRAATTRTAALARHLHDECNRAVDKYWSKPNKKGDVFCIFDDASDDETVAAR